jgi:hypothetical protein
LADRGEGGEGVTACRHGHRFTGSDRCDRCDRKAGEGVRRIDARWIAAGRRRIVARGLRAEGKTFEQIGKELGVSSEQARRDCQ